MDFLKDILRDTYHRHIPDDVKVVERDGKIFFVHKNNRYIPLVLGAVAKTAVATGTFFAHNTIATLATVGTGVIAAGQIQQGRLSQAEGKAQDKIAQANAVLLESQAKSRREVAAMEEQRVSRQQKIFMGRQKAEIGKSGLTMAGSNVDVVADTAYQFASDRLLTLRSGLIESEYMMGSADIQRTQGKWAKSFGKASAKNSYMQAGGTILSGAYFASKAMTAGSMAGKATWAGGNTSSGLNSISSTGTMFA